MTTTTRIIDAREGWPWPAITEHRGSWCEITEEHYHDAIEALPPVRSQAGVPIHAALICIGTRYFANEIPINTGRAQREALCATLAEAAS